MRACWLKWVGRDWSISADYIWLNYSGANTQINRKPTICNLPRGFQQLTFRIIVYSADVSASGRYMM